MLELDQLSVSILSRGTAWLDTGTFSGLHDASSFIRIMEERQNSRIGDPYDVAIMQEWVKQR
jgi:glucose-1-phosphate thymidylyltransferase